ncbi:MAG: endolytic transglycosylase MltG [Gammaproteobacteria bacterium]|nr:endolytic transglycosylase MltG [Gammaproteobacteria bacterium]
MSLALMITAIGSGLFYGWHVVNRPLSIAQAGEWLEVAPGSSLSAISGELAARDIVEHPSALRYFGRLRGDATRIHAGEYRLMPGTTSRTLLDQLVAGQVHLHQLAVIEGWRFDEFRSALRAHPAVIPSELDSGEVMAALGAPGVHPEGQFAPDTYSFARGTPEIEILEQAYQSLQTQLEEVWNQRSPVVAVETPYEALILASIIEKETALATERRQISGVFSRRLQRGMRLQTDPTVIYGLGADFDGNLRRADLDRDTPYNTYTRRGLPPTPIALAGSDALRAAVDPDESAALYFVATGLDDGSHTFSSTLEGHNEAVAAYLRRLRSREAE